MWNEVIGFKIHVFDLAMVTFYVREGDSVLGQYTLPARCIQQGEASTLISMFLYLIFKLNFCSIMPYQSIVKLNIP